jgi:uncharacterized protein (TIGR02453 family)
MLLFEGFPEDFFSFFEELSVNNNRPWFTANKPRYCDSVLLPMGRFITAIAPGLKSISPSYTADPRPNGGSMFRIYRDMRFVKDKTPYKTHAACHFRHVAGRDAHAPGFYVEFATDGIRFGGGIWRPPARQLGMIRAFIADNPAAWEKLRRSAVIRRAGGIQGEALQRPPRGYGTDSRHLEDLKRKTFFVMQNAGTELARSGALVDATISAFRSAAELNRFLTMALELPA